MLGGHPYVSGGDDQASLPPLKAVGLHQVAENVAQIGGKSVMIHPEFFTGRAEPG
jgi:hypothetical protein